MKVSELVDELNIVAPTLSAAGPVPMMTHFWFFDGHVTTYNDRLGMSKPLDLGFDFTAPSLLLDMLKVSYQNGKVEFQKVKEAVKVNIGGGDQKNTFKSYDIEDAKATFTMPKANFNAPTFGEQLGKVQLAIETCMLAISNDQLQPERCGITIMPEDKFLSLYAFNNTALARCTLDIGETGFTGRITVPADFWSIFLNLTKGMVVKDAKKSVLVSLKAKEVLAKVGDVRLLSKTLPVDDPTDLNKIFVKHYTPAMKKNLVPLTEDIGEALDRAMVASTGDDDVFTKVQVVGGVLKMTTDAKNGHANDELDFNHPDVGPVSVKIAMLAKGRKQFDRMAISDDVVAMTKAERVYMVSAKGG